MCPAQAANTRSRPCNSPPFCARIGNQSSPPASGSSGSRADFPLRIRPLTLAQPPRMPAALSSQLFYDPLMDHDRLFKELLTTFFVEFVELFLPDLAALMDRDGLQFLDKEIFTDIASGDRHEVDLLVKARFRGLGEC